MSISILGGGISGLSALHFIKKSKHGTNINAHLYEKSAVPGGWIASEKNNFNFELGPRSIRSGTVNHIADIINDLDLKEALTYPSSDSKGRFVCRNGKLVKVPSSILDIVREPVIRKHMFKISTAMLKNQGLNKKEDESIKDFYSRNIGSDLTNYLLAPVFVGVNGSSIDRLSIKTSQNDIFKASQNHKRFIESLTSLYFTKDTSSKPLKSEIVREGPMFSFKDGLDTLPLRLKERYEPFIKLQSEVKAIHFTHKKPSIELVGQNIITNSDFIISSLPAFEIGRLMRPHNRELSDLLGSIEYASMACISVGFNRDLIPEKYKGFGFLVSPDDKDPILGATLDSVIFPDDKNQTRITFMIGGHKNIHENIIDVTKSSPEVLENIALRSLNTHLGINQKPDYLKINICKNAIPQHFVGHDKKMDKITRIMEDEFPSIKLSNAFVRDVSINGCIDLSYDVVDYINKDRKFQMSH